MMCSTGLPSSDGPENPQHEDEGRFGTARQAWELMTNGSWTELV